jgi:NAD(P)-dependent dehydrogenase (short-subunit alcohol dehydrogenase family)
MEINGIATIVTGGASGLGAAAAERLSRLGAKVTIFDQNATLGVSKANEIGAHFLPVDVTDDAGVEGAIVEAEGLNGTARILINCAGIGPPARIVGRNGNAMPLAEFSRVVAINLIGTFNVLAKFSAHLHSLAVHGEERGVIINTASIAAFDGQIGQAAYSASKGGLVGITLPAARELARYAIRVMTIAPGIFWTPQLATLSQDTLQSLGQQVPFPQRLGRPDEYAQLVESIILNPMLNGETIRLDGAIRMAAK